MLILGLSRPELGSWRRQLDLDMRVVHVSGGMCFRMITASVKALRWGKLWRV